MSELEQDLQIIYKTLEEEKLQHNKTKDNWVTDSNHYKQALQEKEIQISRLRDEINNLSADNQKLNLEANALVDFNHQLESKLALTEQETTETILRLRENIDNLESTLVKKEGDIQSLSLNNASLQK